MVETRGIEPDNANAKPDTAKSDAPTGGDQDFKLDNKAGVEIHALFVSPHDENEWGNDILGRDTLPDGGTIRHQIPSEGKSPALGHPGRGRRRKFYRLGKIELA
jgi:hypothetical protein